MKIETTSISDIGAFGENAAEKYLKKKKYKIIAKNVHAGKSEIDIVAAYKDVLVFVEVKTRSYEEGKTNLSRPADAVNKEKITYLIRGANRFCSENDAKFSDYYKRFDIIEVYLSKKRNKYSVDEVKHFENAIGRN